MYSLFLPCSLIKTNNAKGQASASKQTKSKKLVSIKAVYLQIFNHWLIYHKYLGDNWLIGTGMIYCYKVGVVSVETMKFKFVYSRVREHSTSHF